MSQNCYTNVTLLQITVTNRKASILLCKKSEKACKYRHVTRFKFLQQAMTEAAENQRLYKR